MSTGDLSKHELLQQGVAWVKAEQDALISLWMKSLAEGRIEVYRNMSDKRRHNFAALHVMGLLDRLEQQTTFEVEQIKQTYITYMEKGITMAELVGGVDIQHEALIAKAQTELADRPQMKQILLNRVSYIVNLLKATIAAALIEYQTRL